MRLKRQSELQPQVVGGATTRNHRRYLRQRLEFYLRTYKARALKGGGGGS